MKKLVLIFICFLSLNTSFSLSESRYETTILSTNTNSLTNGITTFLIKKITAISNKFSSTKPKPQNNVVASRITLEDSNNFRSAIMFADAVGDFRSKAVGPNNWNSASSWEVHNGTTWVNATSYPGQNAGNYSVTIRALHIIKLPNNFSTPFQMGDMIINGTLELGTGNAAQRDIELKTNLITISGSGNIYFNGSKISLIIPNSNSVLSILSGGSITYNNPCSSNLKIFIAGSLYSTCNGGGGSGVITFGDVETGGGSINSEIIEPLDNPIKLCDLNTVNLLGKFNGSETGVNYTWRLNGNAISSGALANNTSTTNASFTPTATGQYLVEFTVTTSAGFSNTESRTFNVTSPIDYANLQFPEGLTICEGESLEAFGQVFEEGLTNSNAGIAPGFSVQFGFNPNDTDPSTWPEANWDNAIPNPGYDFNANNDEYQYTFTPASSGTYFYTFRYSLNGCEWFYGGYPNGFWNGNNQNSGVLTVNADHTISLSSGSNNQTVCNNFPITDIVYDYGGGANSATISPALPGGLIFNAATGTISGSPSQPGTYNYTITTIGNSCTVATASGTITSTSLDFVNLQFPASADICPGEDFTIFGQVFEPGITEAAGQGAGIEVEYGYNNANTNPATWTNWANADFNVQANNNDEYKGTIGATLGVGTYYYTFRYRLTGCDWQYGGLGGTWNNDSGVLTVQSLDFVNLQFPASETICEGGEITAFGQVYEPGLTEAAGPGSGIEAQLGYGTNLDPTSWTTWMSANFNVQVDNNDEYTASFGDNLSQGTYNYTFRYRLNGCAWQYGFLNNTTDYGLLTVNSAPEITTTYSNISVNSDVGQCGAIVNYEMASVTGVPTPSVAYSQNSGTFFPVGTTTVTITASNDCGDDIKEFTVTVTDNEAPEALCVGSLTVQLDATGNSSIDVSDIDAGSNDTCDIVNLQIDKSTFDCSNIGANTVTLTVTDSNNNVTTCTTIVTVEDNVDPEIICGSDIDAETDLGECYATISISPPTFSDNCNSNNFALDFDGANDRVIIPSSISLSFSSEMTLQAWIYPKKNTYSRILSNYVGSGSTATGEFVFDTYNGTAINGRGLRFEAINGSVLGISVPNVLTLNSWNHVAATFNNGNIKLFVDGNLVGSTTVTTTDLNIGGKDFIIGEDRIINVPEYYQGAIDELRIWNRALSDQEILNSISTSLNGTEPGIIAYFDFEDGTGSAIVTDRTNNLNNGNLTNMNPASDWITSTAPVSSVSLTNDINGTNDASGVYPLEETIITWTATDASGNTSTCIQTINVKDNEAPNAIAQDVTVQLDVSGNGSTTAEAVDDGSNDACGIASLALSQTEFDCDDVGANTVTLTVTDVNGNVSTTTAVVTVEDNVAPNTIAQDVTVQLDASGNGSTTAESFDDGSNDACGIASLALSQTEFDCDDVGANTVTLTVTDVNGNVSTTTAVVTVEDNIAPNAIAQDVTVQLDVSGNGSTTAEAVDDGSNDACGIASLALSQTEFDCDDVGANTVTLTVTDVNGNVSTTTAVVTVEDNIAPNAIAQDVTVQLDVSGNGSTTAESFDDGSNDACGIASLALSQTEFDCDDVGANTVTLTVTDVNGNVSTTTAVVTVEDNVAPTALCKNATVQLDANGNGSITTADINNGSNDACGIASLSLDNTSFDCSNVGANTVTLTVTDNNGNVSTCSAIVTVEDNVAPTALCKNATVQLDANGNGSITTADINNGSNDACGIASLSLDNTSFDCSNVGANTVTLTVTDNNGNVSTCSATVTVEDNVAPTALCKNATVQLDANGNGSITTTDIDNGSNDACGIASLSLDNTSFDCSNVGANTVTLTVTDNNGNVSTCSATVTVEDNVAPTALCKNATVQLDANGNGSITTADINNGSNDACGIASLSLDNTSFDCSNVGANTVTLTVTDNNGNVSTCSATVTVEDNVAPTALCKNATVQLDANGNGSITTADINNGSNDACGIASLSLDNTTFDCSNVGANTVTLTVTDNNGNVSTCSATVTVEDNVAPTALCKNATVQLDANGNGSITTTDIDNGSNDACGIASLSLDNTSFDCSNVGANTVTLTVTDNNGNVSTCSATVTVEDNAAPTALCKNATVQLDANGNGSITTTDIDNGSNDACGIASLSLDNTSFDCSNVGANTVTLTVTDNNGNVSTCSATVTVEDNVAPTALCKNTTVQLDANGNGSITTTDIDNGSNDACGIASLSLDNTSFDCSNVGANTVTLTVTDNNNNVSTCTTIVTVEDNVAPNAIAQDLMVQLDASGNASITADQIDDGSSDACGIASISVSPNSFTCADVSSGVGNLNDLFISEYIEGSGNNKCIEIYNGTGSNIDLGAGNYTLEVYSNGSTSGTAINLSGTIANGDVHVICNSGAVSTFTLLSDQTSGSVSFNGNDAVALLNNGSAIDIFGAIGEDPGSQWSAGGNSTQNRTLVRNSDITEGNIDNANGFPSLETEWTGFAQDDNSNLGSHSIIGGGVGNTVTLTVTDVNGNVSTATATVTVEDNIPPVAIAQDVTVQLNADGNGSITPEEIDNGSNDACGIESLELDVTDFTCSDVGANTVTLTVTDNNGNQSTATATVTVEDNVNPIAIAKNIVVVLDDTGNVSITAEQIDNGSNDACGIASLELDTYDFTCADVNTNGSNLSELFISEYHEAASGFEKYIEIYNPTLESIDLSNYELVQYNNGNPSPSFILELSGVIGAFQTIVIANNQGTLFSGADLVTNSSVMDFNGNDVVALRNNGSNIDVIGTIGDGNNFAEDVDLRRKPTFQTPTQNFDLSQWDSTPANNVSDLGSHYIDLGGLTNSVTLSVEDVNGNISTATANVTVFDVTAPVLDCGSIQNYFDANPVSLVDGEGSISTVGIQSFLSDNCEVESATLSELEFDCSNISGDLNDLIISEYVDGDGFDNYIELYNGTGLPVDLSEYSIKVYYDNGPVEYALGNIVQDRTATVISHPGAMNSGTISQNTVNLLFDGNDAIELLRNGTRIDFLPVYTSTISLVGTTLIRKNTVNTSNINSSTGEDDWTQFANAPIENLNQHDIIFDENGTNVLLTVKDPSGNTSTCVINVSILDEQLPEVTCQNIVVELDDTGNVSISADQVEVSSFDACGIATSELSKTQFDCSNVGVNTVTLIVTDNNGNSNSCTATVTVEDNSAPNVFTDNITVELNASGNYTLSNADIDVLTRINATDGEATNDNCEISSIIVEPNTFDCSDVGESGVEVTITVTDVNSNSTSETATVFVEDNTAPIISCNAIEVALPENGVGSTYVLTTADIDAISFGSSDNCGILTKTVTPNTFTCAELGDNVVTLTLEDVNGNVSSCTTTVTVTGLVPALSIEESPLPEFCQGAVLVLTVNSDVPVANPGGYLWNSGETTQSVEVGGDGTYGVTVTSATGCVEYIEYTVTGFDAGSLISSYTIVAMEDVFLTGSNLVESGGVGAMNPTSGNIKLHQASTVADFSQAVSISLNQGSDAGDEIYQAANPTLPAFATNTVSTVNSPNEVITGNVTLNGGVYNVIDVREGATVTFSQPNVFINELKTQKTTAIEFTGCTNLIIKERFQLAANSVINSSGQNVVIYVDDDVSIEKGSNVRARIHANDNNILVKGLNGNGNKEPEPTFMTGLFIGSRIQGNKNVIWNADDLCDPCPVVYPNTRSTVSKDAVVGDFNAKGYPNPSRDQFNIEVLTKNKSDIVTIDVFDVGNKLVHSKQFKQDETYRFGDELEGGVYIVKITQGNNLKILRLIKE